MTTVREASPNDRDAIRETHRLAFRGSGEAEPVAALACDLLDEATSPPTFAFVAEADGALVGHVALSPVGLEPNGLTGHLLAPLAVRPDFQRQGIGVQLVEAGIERLRRDGCNVLLVYGDPAYYGRFGFTSEAGARFTPPYRLSQPAGWLALWLGSGEPPHENLRVSCVEPLRDPSIW